MKNIERIKKQIALDKKALIEDNRHGYSNPRLAGVIEGLEWVLDD